MVHRAARILLAFLFLCSPALNPLLSAEDRAMSKTAPFRYDLAICAIFQNEAPFIKEWIEFHKLVGVQHFYLFNNLSDDHYQDVLARYVASGEVDLIEWPYATKDDRDWSGVQCGAYRKGIEAATGKARWLAIIDLDEFLVPVQTDSLVTFLKDYEKYGGVIVNWQMYGTSFVPKIPSDKLMIEMLTLKAPALHGENRLVKSIVHPHRVKDCKDPHIMIYKPGFTQVNSNNQPYLTSTAPIVLDKIRINHYWSRDESYFFGVKVPRRNKWREGFDGMENRLRALNQVPDGTILRFVAPLRRQMKLE